MTTEHDADYLSNELARAEAIAAARDELDGAEVWILLTRKDGHYDSGGAYDSEMLLYATEAVADMRSKIFERAEETDDA